MRIYFFKYIIINFCYKFEERVDEKIIKIIIKIIIKERFYGQEINRSTYNLAKMNMFPHNVNYSNFSIKRGDTFSNFLHIDEKILNYI